MSRPAVVSRRGSARWTSGHPWIYRSDVVASPEPADAGVVAVADASGLPVGQALWSPTSEIRLRRLAGPGETIDAEWWERRLEEAAHRRGGIDATAYRVVHAEGDGLPSLVVDRYGPVAVVQLLSAGLEARRHEVLDAVEAALRPDGVLLRNDAGVRRHEGLPLAVEVVRGQVPDALTVEEHGIRYRVEPATGQKTGAFLDQRENRRLAGRLAAGAAGRVGDPIRCLDAFAFHGSFALHLSVGARTSGAHPDIVALDQSADALMRGRENASLNDIEGIRWVEANAFDFLRAAAADGDRYDLVVLDPPAFAKRRESVPAALRGYKEINLRAMRLLRRGGRLLTFSCSYHVGRPSFLEMLGSAAADSGRDLVLERVLGASADHPELLTVPETGYLKGALIRAL
jgi:23S rRNA (cytosine1962-C5)-methyltransferase